MLPIGEPLYARRSLRQLVEAQLEHVLSKEGVIMIVIFIGTILGILWDLWRR